MDASMSRLRWLRQRAGSLYGLARGPTEHASVTLFVLRFLGGRLLPRSWRTDLGVRVQGLRFYLGAGETTSLREVYEERCYEQVPDFVPGPDWTVVDVGANVGAFALLQARRGARVVAFEPNPDCFARLSHARRANGFDDRLTVLERAVGASPGSARLVVAGGNTLLGSVASPQPGAERQGFDVQRFDVEVDSLDRALPAAGVDRVDLLKLDAEGAEAAILRGAARTLPRVDRVVMEYHSDGVLLEVDAILREAGFDHVLRVPGLPAGGLAYYRSRRP
jgi:FkbM family methyltransferase